MRYSGKNFLLNRKIIDPSEYTYTGRHLEESVDIQLFSYSEDEYREEKNVDPEKIESFRSNEQNSWLNVYGLSEPKIIADICEKQGIHNLTIQDILDSNQRPKYAEFEDFAFITLKSIGLIDNEVSMEQISFVFSDNFLISFQEKKGDFFEHLRERLRTKTGIMRERGIDYLLYAMLEAILDNYVKTLDKLDRVLGEYDLTAAGKEPSPNFLAEIEGYKRKIQFIRKSILPIIEFTNLVERKECRYIKETHTKYFLELKDICLSLLDSCDMISSSLESSINLFFSIQAHRMNQVMKTLTVVATVFIPLTFVAGIYGMNFRYMPELEWRYGYLSIWGIFVGIVLVMVWFFKRKKWF